MSKKKPAFDYIASVEAGNGTVKGLAMGIEKRCVTQMTPFSAAWRQYNPNFELGGDRYPFYTFEGIQRAVGLDAALVGGQAEIVRDRNHPDRYGWRHHRFFVMVALHKLRITSGKVSLVTFMPPGLFIDRDAREHVKEAFLEHSPYHLRYTDDKGEVEEINITLTDVSILPEAAAAAIGMALDENGHPNPTNAATLKKSLVGVVDLGSYTADMLLLRDGRIDPTSVEESTIERLGVDNLIRQPIIKELEYTVDNEVIDAAVMEYVRNGRKGPVMVYTSIGHEFDITDLIEAARDHYFGVVVSKIRERFDLRKIKGLILVGGGSMLIEDLLAQELGSIYIGSKIAEPHLINVESGFRKALADNKLHPDC